MTRYFEAERSAETVIARMADGTDPRTHEIMSAMIRHLHAFVHEVQPSMAEWHSAIDFLTRTGQMCDAVRQEWILASDALGVSMLVDALNNACPAGETESTVLGPFHVAGAPAMPMGADLRRDGKGTPCRVTGRVLDTGGQPISGATLDIWSDAPDGYYDVQKPGEHPPMNLRGRFTTGADGGFDFVTALPVSYPIPDDGPVGELLAAMGRHPWRPAHIHFIVEAPGHRPLVTHIFVAGDAYLESDAVFGVKQSLIADFVDDPEVPGGRAVKFDFVLGAVG